MDEHSTTLKGFYAAFYESRRVASSAFQGQRLQQTVAHTERTACA